MKRLMKFTPFFIRIGSVFTLMGLLLSDVMAQKAQPVSDAYYIDFSKQYSEVYEIKGEHISLQYDTNDDANEWVLELYNWKREKLCNIKLDRQYGLNHYHIALADLGVAWQYDQVYSLETQEASLSKNRVFFKILSPIATKEPVFSIVSNPLELSCVSGSQTTIEYYAQVTKGRSPYELSWYVFNESRTELLFQPAFEALDEAGASSMISIDHALAYYVLLKVKDVCGNEQQQMIFVNCKESDPAVNTLFFEKIMEQDVGNPVEKI